MRRIKENVGSPAPVYDVGSSVEVDERDAAPIKQAIREGHADSLNAGHYTEYPSSWGLVKLRQSIVDVFRERTGRQFDSQTEVMVTGGIIKAVDMAIQSLNVTHVIVPSLSPYFVRSLATLRGKQVIEVPLDLSTGNYDLPCLAERLTTERVERGKSLMYITIPSAPAGTLPGEYFMENELIPFAKRMNIPMISDTYVFATTFSDQPIRPLMSYAGAKDVGVEAIGVAKELGLPGIRIGGVIGHPGIINAMRLFAASSLEMLPLPNQNIAAITFKTVRPEPIGEKLKNTLHQDIIPRFKALNWPIIVPKAGLDMLVEIPAAYQVGQTDHSLVAALGILMKYGVAFSPASVFGTEGDKYLRVVLKQSNHKIPKALDRLKQMGFNWTSEHLDEGFIIAIQKLLQETDLTRL